MGKLFGTDGIRGVANQHPMTCEMAVTVGRAVAAFFGKDGRGAAVVIGRDTRISGPMIEHALIAGICSTGGDAFVTGVLPTPAVAFLTTALGKDAGVVISASHNPFQDNGIKLFDRNGFKLSDETEERIETLILGEGIRRESESVRDIGRCHSVPEGLDRYETFLRNTLPQGLSLSGVTVALDCGNGAVYEAAPRLFSRLGANVITLSGMPNGRNINDGCGSQHPQSLQKKVVEIGAAAGFAFDGDGDRLIAVDEKGRVITGDQILAVCARHMKQTGGLANNLAVSTVMSNLGLRIALKGMGVRHIMADVGDRYVMREMLENQAVLGGEDSGHMIFLNHHTTGDGLLTALRLIAAMNHARKPLSELADIMEVFPQKLVNVEVSEKPDIRSIPEIREAIQRVEGEVGEMGRVLVRYSGTQPLLRVMVEAQSPEDTDRYCAHIAGAVRKCLGK